MAQSSLSELPAARKGRRLRSQTPTNTKIAPTGDVGSPNAGRKRKLDGERSATPASEPKRKRPTKSAPIKSSSEKSIINVQASQRLDTFVFGEGSNAELGLGPDRTAAQVKRPRLNLRLGADDTGIVAFGCGATHTLAVTHDGKVMSWGANANGALGRNTEWRGGSTDVDNESEDFSDSSNLNDGLNPYESTPTVIDSFPEGTRVVEVAAGESISLALTDDGHVYGWGCFRNQSGIMGFYQPAAAPKQRTVKNEATSPIFVQREPHLYSELKNITDIACGSNHAMALSKAGEVFVWGCGEQNQLGHHINERLDIEGKASLTPSPLRTGRRKYKAIFSGKEHSFAIDTKDQVLAWGLNNFGATGVEEGAGGTSANVFVPTVVESLSNPADPVRMLCGGQFHSLAITRSGKCLAFGRLDGLQLGLDTGGLPAEDLIFDDNEPPRPRILIKPTPILDIGKVRHAACGATHSIVVNEDGEAFSWGVGTNYQTGLGTSEGVKLPTRIDNTAVRDRKLAFVGCGNRFSVLCCPA